MRRAGFILFTLFILTGCGLEKMSTDFNKVDFVHDPEILTSHAGSVAVNFKGVFPKQYFAKKAILEIRPFLIDEYGDEVGLDPIILQGQEASGGAATIFYEMGGDFSYSNSLDYKESMLKSRLELRPIARMGKDSAIFTPVTIANGVLSTSYRVLEDPMLLFADHRYEDTTILSESATIYFLVNKSDIRTSETSREDVKRLQSFVNQGFPTHSFVIKSYASPEGTISNNDKVSQARNESTMRYAKNLLLSINVDGADNDNNYKRSSIGEDWNGFYDLVKQSNIDDKNIINRIVKSNKTADQKEQAIRDMAAVYDAVDKNILPFLRKSEITINSYKPKKTAEEIRIIVDHDTTRKTWRSLDVDELLYAVDLFDDFNIKMNLLDYINAEYNDWRSYNNQAVLYLYNDIPRGFGLDSKASYLQKQRRAFRLLLKAREMGGDQPEILNNLGTLYSMRGEFEKAKDLFLLCKDYSAHNRAVLDLKQGNYSEAARYFNTWDSYNATLSKILNGNNMVSCGELTPECFYLNAVIAARQGDLVSVVEWLNKVFESSNNIYFRELALKDIEFNEYRETQEFKSLPIFQ